MITMTTMPMMPMMMRRGCGRLRILSAIVVAMLMMFSPVLVGVTPLFYTPYNELVNTEY
jgi:hypothetical protein